MMQTSINFKIRLRKAKEAELIVTLVDVGAYEIKCRYGMARVQYPESMTYINIMCTLSERHKRTPIKDIELVAFSAFVDKYLDPKPSTYPRWAQ